ncbi:MAG: GGDEF domain-containing protein [Betaproteobacteria bacterium HGW-Betaproteobacteria-7]|nr:MAG: GGDEF domain-containing protein [Betaproteobacteria bacterium HGW-Betaproteobacteria-7]
MHSPTLLILAAILMGIMALMLLAAWRFNRQIAGFGAWTLAYLSGFLFCISLLLRPALPEIASVLAAQVFIFLMAYLNLTGTRAYIGLPVLPKAYPMLGLAALLVVSTWFTLVEPNGGARFAVSSLMIGSIFLLCARTIAKGKIHDYPARYLYATASGFHGLFLLLRPWLFALGSNGLFDEQQAIALSQFVIIESIVTIVLMAFAIVMLANERVTLELRSVADCDPLTGTFNRRSFLTLLDKSISVAVRGNTPLSVMLVDLDHFKKINDTWGHQTGDEALRHFVAVAENCVRHGDVIGRMGGEEFAIFLPHAGLVEAMAAANRLLVAIETHPVANEPTPISMTASIGVADWQPGETAETVLNRADESMYRAKRRGRNRVEQAPTNNRQGDDWPHPGNSPATDPSLD